MLMDLKKAAAVALLVCTGSATADLIWDYGPATGTHGGNWVNRTESQNFAEQVIFEIDMYLTDFHLFTTYTDSPSGDYHVKILYDDGAGNPGAMYMQWDQEVNDITVDNSGNVMQYKHTFEFDEVLLEAGTIYWIGVSANGWEVGQSSVVAPGDGMMAQFSGSTFAGHTGVGDQMFQLTGYEVPAPAGLALLGCAGLISRRRRR
jgi:hypothetical protein